VIRETESEKRKAESEKSKASGAMTAAPDASGLNLDDPHPLWSLLKQAAPNVASMMSYTVMQFVDGIMVSRIGPDPVYVSAHGTGSIATIWPLAIGMGLIGMTNTYASQHVGAGSPRKASPYAWNGLWLGLGLWLLLLPYALALPLIFSKLGHSAHLVELESQYARIVLLGSVMTLCARGMAQFFYGIQRPGVVLAAVIAGNITNFACNYLLIFGNETLHIPALGVPGSAIGMVIGLAVEFTVPIVVFLGPAMNERFGTRGAWRLSIPHIKDLAKTGWPAGLTYGSEMACWWVFMGILAGRFGEAQQTASWIVHRYMALSFMPAVGVSFAVTAIVGKCLGAGRPDLARQRAWLGVRCAMVYMSCCALIMLLLRHELAGLFIKEGMPQAQQAEIMTYAAKIMIVAAVFQVFDGLGITVFGVLRGAGDTLAPGIATAVLSWTCIVGVGWAMTEYARDLGALGAWIGAGLYIVLMSVFLGWRFLGGAWMKKKLLEESAVSTS
jgi:MATE family multidrug resistance protein